MAGILIFGGTTEGRQLAQILCEAGVDCEVSVATAYGDEVMPENPHLQMHTGRLEPEQMCELFQEKQYLAIVDATHPYAKIVSENVKGSAEKTGISYLRLQREETAKIESEAMTYFDSVEGCVQELVRICEEKQDAPKVFLTTGSKDLPLFCSNEALRKQLIVRVLPALESLEICKKQGLEGKQILAMQGPFSEEMNRLQLQESGAEILVTKESGAAGGFLQKIRAAKSLGKQVFVIGRPAHTVQDASQDYSMEQICQLLSVLLGVSLWDAFQKVCCPKVAGTCVTLLGIGMGRTDEVTVAAAKAMQEADMVFGASRMLRSCETYFKEGAQVYPYYLAKDILPILQENTSAQRVAILFSGDTGFYSGCEKMKMALQEVEGVTVLVLPGISTMSALAARLGISYQDATIISLHGVDPSIWKPQLQGALQQNAKVFFLTSGVQDLHLLAEELLRFENAKTDSKLALDSYEVALGFQLSYPEEKVAVYRPDELLLLTQDGLYAGFLQKILAAKSHGKQAAEANTAITANGTLSSPLNKVEIPLHRSELSSKRFTPGMPDTAFIRGEVPMTKEEVRALSICKLQLAPDSICYDIGSGTGSVSAEIAMLSDKLQVVAFESNPVAVSLSKENYNALGLSNIRLVEGMAPDSFSDALPIPTHAFIGGSRGHMGEMLSALQKLNPSMRIVINAVSLESICQVQALLPQFPVTDLDIVQVGITKTREIGKYHMLQATNPVFIFAFRFSTEMD